MCLTANCYGQIRQFSYNDSTELIKRLEKQHLGINANRITEFDVLQDSLKKIKTNQFRILPSSGIKDPTSINIILDFPFSAELLQIMANDLTEDIDNKWRDPLGNDYLDLIAPYTSVPKKQQFQELAERGELTFGKEDNPPSIILINKHMDVPVLNYYTLLEGPFTLASAGKNGVHKEIDGAIEIIEKRTGDIVSVYLEYSKKKWYFFTYTRGLLQAVSSSKDFNSTLMNLKESNRKFHSGNTLFSYHLCSLLRKNEFMARLKAKQDIASKYAKAP